MTVIGIDCEARIVLVVEDEAIIRMMLIDSLEDAGFRVVEAEDADAAIAHLKSDPNIDAVITDVRMPGSMDGIGLARWMRTERPTTPIIITSGFATPPDIASINPAISLIVPKPYQPLEAPSWLSPASFANVHQTRLNRC